MRNTTIILLSMCSMLHAAQLADASNDVMTYDKKPAQQAETNRDTVYFWDFETGEQGWTHTNGQLFPAAWDVVSSSYTVGSYTIAPPDAGDSSFCIDGDLGGVCHDTAMSPIVSSSGVAWFKWGVHFQNYVSNQNYVVIIRTFSSGAWNPWISIFSYYWMDTPPRYDSVDISATVGDSVQVGFVYNNPSVTGAWFAAFDNAGLYTIHDHDVGCLYVISPPSGPAAPDVYDIIGHIFNLGANSETFDVRATVFDTTNWIPIFDETVTLVDFPSGADTSLTFGTVLLGPQTPFYTEIYTLLGNDMNPSNDTSVTYTHTVGGFWQYELDITAATGDNQCMGIEFDGTYFYITGANSGTDPNKVYVIDTLGNLIWALDQPAHSTGWGWRNIWWDYSYSGPGGIGYLYASYGGNAEQFSIDLQGGVLIYHGFFPLPPFLPYVTSIVYMPDSDWYFSPSVDSIYKWTWVEILQAGPHPGYSIYDGAYDTDSMDGGWVWWHSQDDPGPGFLCQISQMDAITMEFTGLIFGYSLPLAITDGVAGGICFYEGFRNYDMLFALVQGTPHDYIVGVPVRMHVGVEEKPSSLASASFGFSPSTPNPITNTTNISFTITNPGRVSLKVYDAMGRLVRTLFEGHEQAGQKTFRWDGKDEEQRRVPNGCYFLKLEAGNNVDVQKLVLLK